MQIICNLMPIYIYSGQIELREALVKFQLALYYDSIINNNNIGARTPPLPHITHRYRNKNQPL